MVRHTLSRISHIVRANVNEVLDQLEDPEKMVRQMVRDMEHDVDRLAAAVGTAVASRLRLQREQESRRRRSEQLRERARQALEADDEDLARELVERRLATETAAVDMEPALTESDTTVKRLKEQLASLRQELADARQRQGTLIAKLRARREPRGADIEARTDDPQAEVQRLEQRLRHNRGEFERLRQRLELEDLAHTATAEVRRDLDGGDAALDGRFEDLELRQRVDAELDSLRGTQPETDR